MSSVHNHDGDREDVKLRIARAFDVDPELLEPTAEEIEIKRRFTAFRDALPRRSDEIAEQITARAHRDGWLPENWRFVYRSWGD